MRRENVIKDPRDDVTFNAIDFYDAIKSTTVVALESMTDVDEEIMKILDPSNKAIIISSHALGNAPYPIRRAVVEAAKNEKLVINVSRAFRGNTSERYAASLSNVNKRELGGSGKRIIDGGRLSSRNAIALMVRTVLEKRNQADAEKLVQEYKTRTF
jgi:L-asparaginase/Glu-tRNA(Gln) amidotransferase subunit D